MRVNDLNKISQYVSEIVDKSRQTYCGYEKSSMKGIFLFFKLNFKISSQLLNCKITKA